MQYRSVRVADSKGVTSQYIPDDQEFSIELEIEASRNISDIYFGMILQNQEGINVLFADSRDVAGHLPDRFQTGIYKIDLHLPPVFAPGTYSISLGIATVHPVMQLDNVESACSFEILNNSNEKRTAPRPGFLNLHIPWKLDAH